MIQLIRSLSLPVSSLWNFRKSIDIICTNIRIKIAWKLFALTISILSPIREITDNDFNWNELF